MYWTRWKLTYQGAPWSLWHEIRWDGKQAYCRLKPPSWVFDRQRSDGRPETGICAKCAREADRFLELRKMPEHTYR